MPTKRRPKWPEPWRLLAAGFCALWLAQPGLAAPSQAERARPAAKIKAPDRAKVHRKPRSALKPRIAPVNPPMAAYAAADGIGFFGMASFYGYGFQGRLVANGERFDVRGMTAASNRVPLGTWVAVRREDSGRCIVVKVNDRMHVKHKVRVIDLSRGAAEKLRMITAGVVMVRVVPLKGQPDGDTEAVCQSLFASTPEEGCPACVEPLAPPSLPGFDPAFSGSEQVQP